ncbi:MAG: hypothetical protein ACI8ZM_002534 [Crocinitomix sp.]|jgi:hypothetical protein
MGRAKKEILKLPQLVVAVIIGILGYSILVKVTSGFFQSETFEDGLSFQLNYEFECKKGEQDSTYYIKAFIPQSNSRQFVAFKKEESEPFTTQISGANKTALWEGDLSEEKEQIRCSFELDLFPTKFEIANDVNYSDAVDLKSFYVQPSDFIASNDPEIEALALELLGEEKRLDAVLTKIFDHVYDIPVQPIKHLMTASEALERNAASCNGKSRLFVALCRNLGLPARVSGGIILNTERKKTSHLWAEVKVKDEWIPFDPLNGYYAYLPSNYLEVYKGDEFLVKRSSDMLFDYNYEITLIESEVTLLEGFNMFSIAEKTGLSTNLLSLLLLLPIGALIVAIFRNVIGLKTFGVFLPVLIAISFTATGLLFGVVSFVGVLLVISLLNYPMLKMGILHVPKLVVMLSAVVFFMVIILFVGVRWELVAVGGVTFFPIVILTISAEKYARIVVEEGFVKASKILFQTILVTLFCYAVVGSDTIYLLVMNFPELLILVAILSLMLGKWIGLRVSEYKRFGWIVS